MRCHDHRGQTAGGYPVSVIVPCYRPGVIITRCLNSLLAQDVDCAYEIVVVDSSPDETRSLIRDAYPQITIIHSDDRLLPGAARNLGAARACGEILAFIDVDCVADRTWLQAILQAIRRGYRMTGGAVANLNPRSLIGSADFLLTFNEFLPQMPRREVSYLPSINMACTKALFREVGGFLVDMPTGEDMVFTFTASKATQLLFEPTAVVYHQNREDPRGFVLHHYVYGTNASLIRRAHGLPGNLLARVPLLAFIAPLARAARVSYRVLRWGWRRLPHIVLVAPWVILGIAAWGCGFIRASFSSARPD